MQFKKYSKIRKLIIIEKIICILAVIFFTASIYIKNNYNLTSFDQVLLTLQTGTTGTGYAVIKDIILQNIIILPLVFLGLYFPIKYLRKYIYRKNNEKVKNIINEYKEDGETKEVKEAKKDALNNVVKFEIGVSFIYFILLILSIVFLFSSLKLNKDFFNLLLRQTTKIYDNKYVDPKKVKMEFKDGKKKNLIYIVAESLESSTFSRENGGKFDESVTPELEKYAKENISFSHTDKLGGFKMAPGATLTTGALVSLNAGVSPIVNFDHFLELENEDKYMPGAYSIGQFLEKEGYDNQFILGSDANYGKRKLFYNTHGVGEIVDYHEAKKRGYIEEDYFDNWWGYEDEILFKIAKNEITKKAESGKPFFTTLLTVDTHFPDGQLPKDYERKYDKQYLDAYNNASKMIDDFISWLKEQDFYKDTVVVITGDHLTMQTGFFGDGERYVYNAIINSDKVFDKSKLKNRKFVTTDMTPTTLSALGVEIEGDRFGMGTDLFSDKKTYTEELGYDKYIRELQKLSGYYNKYISNDSNLENLDIDKRINNDFDYDFLIENHDHHKK